MSEERTCIDCGTALPPKTGKSRPPRRCVQARIRAGKRQQSRKRYGTDPDYREREKAGSLRSRDLGRSSKDRADRDRGDGGVK